MKNKRKFINPLIIIGILLSIIISLILYITGIETISSLLIALLGIILTLQIDQIARTEQSFYKNTKYFEMIKKMEVIPWLYPSLNRLVNSTNAILTSKENSTIDKLVRTSIKSKIGECNDYVNNIKNGKLINSTDDWALIISFIDKAQSSIKTTCFQAKDGSFDYWKIISMQNYLDANKKAIERGVIIERIFIYDVRNDQLEKIIKDQNNCGIKAFKIHKSELSESLLEDIMVIDRKFWFKFSANAKGEYVNNILHFKKLDIDKGVKIFENIKSCAQKFIESNA